MERNIVTSDVLVIGGSGGGVMSAVSALREGASVVLVAKGKGMEINTSGVDRCGCFLPEKIHLQRFRELGGEIITLGSDAHDPSRVGQYAKEALDILKDVFGHVCTFENRKPIFHKL